jgi:hypothetical protein
MGLHRLQCLLKEGERIIKRRIFQAKRRAAHRCGADAPYLGGKILADAVKRNVPAAGWSRLNPFARGHALLRSLRRRDENAIDDAVGVRLTE